MSPHAAGPGPRLADLDLATAREILQQPELWLEVTRHLDRSRARIDAFLGPIRETSGLRVILTGAGSSAFAGAVIASALSRLCAGGVEALATTDLVSSPLDHLDRRAPTLVVSFARSGDSPESLAAVALVDRLLPDAHHLVITCNAAGRLARDRTDAPRTLTLDLPVRSSDAGFAMTSSLTSMMLAALLAFDGARTALVGTQAEAARRVMDEYEIAAQVLVRRSPQRIVYLGSGPLKALAQESALKVLELTAGQVVAIGESSLGLRHGPKAFLRNDALAIVYLSSDPDRRPYDLDIVTELAAELDPGNVLVIAARPDGIPAGVLTWLLRGLDGADDASFALPAVVCAQLVAVHAALAAGLDVDNPFPSGEVNRVVQGVTIHPLADRGLPAPAPAAVAVDRQSLQDEVVR